MSAILGISAFYHDAAAALLIDGRIVAAAQEERFTRRKHDPSYPAHAIAYCLRHAGLRPDQLDDVAFYDRPDLKWRRLLTTYLAYAPQGWASFRAAMPQWWGDKLHVRRTLRQQFPHLPKSRFIFTEHHLSHAASAYYPSPFAEAAVLTLDGVGEWATGTIGVGRGRDLHLIRQMNFPHSLGLLYSAFTYYCGFKVNSGEYKLMGLAPYGQPVYADTILREVIHLHDDGSFHMNQACFNYCQGLTMTSQRFNDIFGGPPRPEEAPLTQRHMDLAASIQAVTEQVMLRCARHAQQITGMRNLCLAGGVALNCVGNGRLLREGPFEKIWIQPAAGDAGGALGAAWWVWHQTLGQERRPLAHDAQQGSFLGPEFSDEEIGQMLGELGAEFTYCADDDELCAETAQLLAQGLVVGWVQGRMEFGPRALGARSILGDARRPEMQSVMNLKIKFRESFRPFAPIVLQERAHEYFDVPPAPGSAPGFESPYMLLVTQVAGARREMESGPKGHGVPSGDFICNSDTSEGWITRLQQVRSDIPAVTHVDGSARVQTVDQERHPLLHRLLTAFDRRTGCPVLVNTSFNIRGEPIVCTPRQAYRCFQATHMDALVLGHFVLRKVEQPQVAQAQVREYLASVAPD